jgi:hypothetical protein
VPSGEKWSPDPDVRGFASILFEIIVGHPAIRSEVVNDQNIPFRDIRMFVLELITSGQSSKRGRGHSFNDIFNILKNHNFEILAGVASMDVLAFVDWVESFE